MALNTTITAIAGPYTATWGGATIGVVEDGFELEQIQFAEPVRGDNLGDSKQDGVYRGQDVFINFVLQEWGVAKLANAADGGEVPAAPGNWTGAGVTGGTVGVPWHPFSPAGVASLAQISTVNNQVGVLQSDYSAPLVLTAVANTPADRDNYPQTLTVNNAILAENFPIRLLFAARHRKIPMRMQSIPDSSLGWFSFSAV